MGRRPVKQSGMIQPPGPGRAIFGRHNQTIMSTTQLERPAAKSGTFKIGGDLPVVRLGFGAMRITGRGIWGEPEDREECIAVLRRAVELGITLIDTADSYGPFVSEKLIAEALYPYPKNLVIATKAGLQRPGPDQWEPDGRPAHLRERCEGSLKRLRVDRLDLFQLHRIDPKVPLEDQIGTLLELQKEGKVRHLGLSEVTVKEIEQVRKLARIATVQNLYNLTDRHSEAVLDYCTRENLGFIPWFPLATGNLAGEGSPLAAAAKRLNASPGQVALAWLLKKSPVMLPIPGTSKVEHLESNAEAALLEIDDDLFEQLDAQSP
jgi:aryl-alcohol dehydrogenase-like predicted oxidoreductase